nr:CoA transferase [Pseudonocardia bannensis]
MTTADRPLSGIRVIEAGTLDAGPCNLRTPQGQDLVRVSLGDSLAGTFAALGAAMALQARECTGRGQVVDCAIYEAVLALMEALLPERTVSGKRRERSGSDRPGRFGRADRGRSGHGVPPLLPGDRATGAVRRSPVRAPSGARCEAGGARCPDLAPDPGTRPRRRPHLHAGGGRAGRPGPELGRHHDEIYRDLLGLGGPEPQALRADGAL